MAEHAPAPWIRNPQLSAPSLFEKFCRRAAVSGLRKTARIAGRVALGSLSAWYWDMRHRTETRKKVYVSDLGLPDGSEEHAIHYEPLTAGIAAHIERLKIPFEQFTFIDLGAGKGKVVLLASDFPFHSAIGVELSPMLVESARRNARRYRDRHQKCKHLEMILADAAEYKFPMEPLVIFTAHSFDGTIMERLVKNLRSSLQQVPRETYFIYCHPVCRAILDEAGWLALIDGQGNRLTYKCDLSRV